MAKAGSADSGDRTTRIWVVIDPTVEGIMKLGALYVLFATLDKTGGFARKAGVTKRLMAHGVIRSFIFKARDRRRVLRALNAHEAMAASADRNLVAEFKGLCI